METIEKSTEVLNDLIEINNDRIKGFEKAIADLGDGDADLKSLFQQYSEESRKNTQELTSLVSRTNQSVEDGTSISGALHRAWIDVKATFSGSDRTSILSECERGEDEIKKAYKNALSEGQLSGETYSTVAAQANTQMAAHDRVKALRDSSKQ